MTPRWRNTVLFHTSQYLPHFGIRPLKVFLSWHWALQGPPTSPFTLLSELQTHKDTVRCYTLVAEVPVYCQEQLCICMHFYAFVKSTHVLVDFSLIWCFHGISLHYLLDFVLVPCHENCHLALFQGFQASCDWSLDGVSAFRNDLLIKCHHLDWKGPTILK